MNLLTEAKIEIETNVSPDGGIGVKRTILGSTGSLLFALVATMRLEPDFAEVLQSAVRMFSDPRYKDD